MSAPKIKRSNLPEWLPINGTVVWWLLLDRLHAPGWVWGVTGTLIVLVWISSLISIFTAREVDLLASSRTGGQRT